MPYEALYESWTRAYTAPSRRTCTLSFVIAVCGWIGIVVSFMLRLYAMLSTNGIAKLSPGCAMYANLPKRSIIHSSACGTIMTQNIAPMCAPSRPTVMSRRASARRAGKRGSSRRERSIVCAEE